MNTYRVRHNFKVYNPGRWAGDYVRLYGPRNEGVEVAADSPAEAVAIFAADNHKNPTYLEAVEP
jgi:hypothetical protein